MTEGGDGLPDRISKIQNPKASFEKTILQALEKVKDGSITVIKQDNVIIQVNIYENLKWSFTLETGQLKDGLLKLLS